MISSSSSAAALGSSVRGRLVEVSPVSASECFLLVLLLTAAAELDDTASSSSESTIMMSSSSAGAEKQKTTRFRLRCWKTTNTSTNAEQHINSGQSDVFFHLCCLKAKHATNADLCLF